MKTEIVLAAACFALWAHAEKVRPPEPANVPELLVTAAGEKVETREAWEKTRRPELFRLLMENEYGVRPVERPADLRFERVSEEEVLGGKATKTVVKGTYAGPGGGAEFTFAAWIPKSARPVPAFVHVSPRPAITADDPNGPRPTYRLPTEYVTARGYAVLASCDYDFSLDWHQLPDSPTSGVFKAFGPKSIKGRGRNEWGILSAWAWGASRLMDWVETDKRIDSSHVGVVGLSRNGKTALLAGATDQRFAMVVSCCSGCGGAKLNHLDCDGAETIEQITRPAWKWFCPAFADWKNKDALTPFDQHQFLALVAPRLLYVSSASEDAWAGQRGEFASARPASPAWELYGKAGLVEHGFPSPDSPLHAGNVGYHLRSGLHDITLYDWENYLDFADGHGWRVALSK